MQKIKTDKDNLINFGLIMALAFMLLAVVLFLKHKRYQPVMIVSLLFLACALTAPRILENIYIAWMKFAHVLAWVNTRILLTLIFIFVFTPMGFIMRLAGKDLLDLKIKKEAETYWHKKEKKVFNKEDYYRQF